MELYIHLPFCARKCRYCDFASYTGCDSYMPAYVDAVLLEARYQAELLGHPVMDTVFLGGGTPSLLPAPLLEHLIRGLRSLFPFGHEVEFTSEANPGTLTLPWLETAAAQGVNRLSMGMQAYQKDLLAALGRIHTFEQVCLSAALVREAGIHNLSLDLMFGLPGQTEKHWQETLSAAISLRPQHLSCYGLIPEEGTPLKADLDANRLSLPDEEMERAMYDHTIEFLAAQGMRQYEISNFALPGYECRHNLGYWRQIPYLGLGASASSMLPSDGQSDLAYTRSTNPSGLKPYMDMVRSRSWCLRETEGITRADARYETLMLGLRTTDGVWEQAFWDMHGMTLDSCYGPRLHALAERGLLLCQQGRWRLTRRGMDVQNAVLVELMDD